MALSTQPYKGARDFYPDDKRLQKYIFGKIRRAVEKFGYEEYDAPILEPIEIFAAKTGDEIVNEQTYSFEDRGGRKVVIRPEMTPSVSRMVAARRQELAYPLRWYSIVDNWRYERPQRGRQRQFYQLNVDIFGVDGLEADFENIQVADSVLQALGANRSHYTVKVNSRRLMDLILKDYLELDAVQTATLSKLIDRMPKMEYPAFVAETDALFTPTQRESGLSDKLMDLLKVDKLENLPDKLKSLESVKELEKLFSMLLTCGISNIEFSMSIMRGFDYYTDIVFEVFDTNPENNRSMFGGGRYDGLVSLFGVEQLPAVGFAMGDVTLTNFLAVHELMPGLVSETDIYAVALGDVSDRAQKVIDELREMGVNIAVAPSGRKVEKEIKVAVKKGIPYMLFVGEKELADEQFTLRNLNTSTEERHSLQRIVSIVKDYRKQ